MAKFTTKTNVAYFYGFYKPIPVFNVTVSCPLCQNASIRRWPNFVPFKCKNKMLAKLITVVIGSR